MIALISFLLVILISIIIVRVGSVALELTGLSRDVASFQAQSAFSGTGFTTSESEYVVSSPVRRRIVRILIFLGSAGITSAITTLVLMFMSNSAGENKETVLLLVAGLILLFLFWRSKVIERAMRRIIKRVLSHFTSFKIHDYSQLLGLCRGYSIGEVLVKKGSWLANRKLEELQLRKEGVLVLGIYRKKNGKETFLGVPDKDTTVIPGDLLVCYGPDDVITTLSERVRGDKGEEEHEEAMKKLIFRKVEEETETE